MDDAHKNETADLHNFQILKQSLVDAIKYANKGIEESGEKKAVAEGDLAVTLTELTLDVTTLRKKEAYAKVKADSDANLAALTKAITALESGMAGSFIQTALSKKLQNYAAEKADIPDRSTGFIHCC